MVMSDPIADMLTRIRNGYLAKKAVVAVPYSRVKNELAKLLVKEKFLAKVEKPKATQKEPQGRWLHLKLSYQNNQPVLTGVKRISKPGMRIYARAKKIPLVRLGFGVTIVSTPAGLMTNKEAKKKNLGGEVICQVW